MFKDKVVIVTGSSSGIGEAIALKFGSLGAKVVVNFKSNKKGGEKVAEEIEKMGGEVLVVQGDMSSEDAVKKLFNDVISKFGRVDVLINNAGLADEPDFFDAKKSDWIESLNNNLISTMLCSQYAGRLMLKQKEGRIVNVSSIYGAVGAGKEGLISYSAAKAAVSNFTQTLAKLLAPIVNVNAVAPGYVETPAWEGTSGETIKHYLNDNTYLKRWIKPSEIAEACVYLASADAVTGEVLIVDAGRILTKN